MFTFLVLADCLGWDREASLDHQVPGDLYPGPPPSLDQELKAQRIFDAVQSAEKPGHELRLSVKQIVHPSAWSDRLVHCILERIERAIHDGVKMGPALKEAFDKAVAAATGFACDHPVYATLIAIGILVLLLPWVVEVLGFTELGPVEGRSSELKLYLDLR